MSIETPGRCAFIFIIIGSTIPMLLTGCFLVRTLLLLRKEDPKCENLHLEWDLWFSVFLLLFFLMGTIGVLLKVKFVQITCMILLVLTTFSFLVIAGSMHEGGTFDNDTKRIDINYRLETYASWAQKFFLKKSGNWNTFQNCLIERKICDKLDKKALVQGGCCVPPPYCGYEGKNGTWVIPTTGRYADEVNCVRWDSERRKLCYYCETCQAAYIGTIVENWGHRASAPYIGAAILLISYICILEYDVGRQRRLILNA